MDVLVFPGGENGRWKQKDWQWEYHVIPFGTEGMLPGKSSLAHRDGNREAASTHWWKEGECGGTEYRLV